MIGITIVTFITLLLQQQIQITQAANCASNPCNLVAGIYDGFTGYCCYDVPPNYTDFICTCPNTAQLVLNTPCRTGTTNPINPTGCSRPCVNGGVCNIVNGQEVCWCQLGFSGANCEVQGIQTRCAAGVCQFGTCYEQTIGISTYAYCQCTPGYTGTTCNQSYFTCTATGVFPDTAQCGIEKYFYCQQGVGAPVSASCPARQKFNRFTNQCDSAYQCT